MADKGIAFPAAHAVLDALDGVAEADCQHWLARVFQDVDDATGGVLEENMATVGEKVNLRGSTHGIHEALAKLALKKTKDAADLLQRESAGAQFADDGNLGKIVERVEPLVALAGGNNEATFIPPLQLTQADAGETGNVTGCEA